MSLLRLLKRLHRNERGAVSLETILLIAAVALPVLIFFIKFVWPSIRDFFDQGMHELKEEAEHVRGGGSR